MDFQILDNRNGGDLVFSGGDLKMVSEIYNQPYLARFGGNVQNSTSDEFLKGEEHNDWWANALFLEGKPNEQLNSKFEKTLNETTLNLQGQKTLESIAKKDLDYLKGITKMETNVYLPNINRVQLHDNFLRDNENNFSYIWDNAKNDII